eukprot:16435140-Heterocapsa_arctica.AAC.1
MGGSCPATAMQSESWPGQGEGCACPAPNSNTEEGSQGNIQGNMRLEATDILVKTVLNLA